MKTKELITFNNKQISEKRRPQTPTTNHTSLTVVAVDYLLLALFIFRTFIFSH